jgi:hypothetical protein
VVDRGPLTTGGRYTPLRSLGGRIMVRKMVLGLGLLAASLFAVGCNSASSGAKVPDSEKKDVTTMMKEKAGEAAKDAKEAVKDAAKDAKEAVKDAKEWTKEHISKAIEDDLPKVEEKIKAMSGDAGKKAKEAFEAFKKQFDEFKAAPADKIREQGEKLKEAFAKLKTQVGL